VARSVFFSHGPTLAVDPVVYKWVCSPLFSTSRSVSFDMSSPYIKRFEVRDIADGSTSLMSRTTRLIYLRAKNLEKGCHCLPLTREELKPFGITIGFKEANVLGSSLTLDEVLIDWYRSKKDDLMQFLAVSEMEPEREHACRRKLGLEGSNNCFYLSPGRHVRRSRLCPEVLKENQGIRHPTSSAEPLLSVAGEMASPAWAPQYYLDASDHDFGSLSLRESVSRSVMGGVLNGTATREELWILEGVVFRQFCLSEDLFRREAFALMWAAIYRAKSGIQASFYFFECLRIALDSESPAKRRMVTVERGRDPAQAWSDFIYSLLFLRDRWANAADITSRLQCSTSMFPSGVALGETGVSGRLPYLFGRRLDMRREGFALQGGFKDYIIS
jgi:hypothetical protein